MNLRFDFTVELTRGKGLCCLSKTVFCSDNFNNYNNIMNYYNYYNCRCTNEIVTATILVS